MAAKQPSKAPAATMNFSSVAHGPPTPTPPTRKKKRRLQPSPTKDPLAESPLAPPPQSQQPQQPQQPMQPLQAPPKTPLFQPPLFQLPQLPQKSASPASKAVVVVEKLRIAAQLVAEAGQLGEIDLSVLFSCLKSKVVELESSAIESAATSVPTSISAPTLASVPVPVPAFAPVLAPVPAPTPTLASTPAPVLAPAPNSTVPASTLASTFGSAPASSAAATTFQGNSTTRPLYSTILKKAREVSDSRLVLHFRNMEDEKEEALAKLSPVELRERVNEVVEVDAVAAVEVVPGKRVVLYTAPGFTKDFLLYYVENYIDALSKVGLFFFFYH